MNERTILHSYMNCFYASVEMMLDPKLRKKAVAGGVQITIKSNELTYKQYQAPFTIATRSLMIIAEKVRSLFSQHYEWQVPVRAITVRAINLLPQELP